VHASTQTPSPPRRQKLTIADHIVILVEALAEIGEVPDDSIGGALSAANTATKVLKDGIRDARTRAINGEFTQDV
jgi:hypothetical protein